MNLEGLDLYVISKHISHLVERVTCFECCKYYIAPEAAPCGHSLCHGCWAGRRACPSCQTAVTRRALKLSVPLRIQTEHVHALADGFERLFGVKLDEIDIDTVGPKPKMLSNDPTKHVQDWLASSQNHFSAPVLSTQPSPSPIDNPTIELKASKVQIHTHTKKVLSPRKVVKTPQPQEDWDKIETIPDTEDVLAKNNENIVGPMDIEPFQYDDDEYNNERPRRSSRKKDLVPPGRRTRARSCSVNSESATGNKLKTKQNWSNVKKMKKEFSKLGNVNKSKLNVSIEMCKKAKGTNKDKVTSPLLKTADNIPYSIEDDTPNKDKYNRKVGEGDAENVNPNINISDTIERSVISDDKNKKSLDNESDARLADNEDKQKATNVKKSLSTNKTKSIETSSGNKRTSIEDLQSSKNCEETPKSTNENKESDARLADHKDKYKTPNVIKSRSTNKTNSIEHTSGNKRTSIEDLQSSKNCEETPKSFHMPFIRRSTLLSETNKDTDVQIIQNEVNSADSTKTGDVEISIKIGNTVTNIVIRQKQKDVSLKVNADSAIQTSLGPHHLAFKEMCDKGTNAQDKNTTETSEIGVNVNLIELDLGVENKLTVNKSSPLKLDTASADTVSAQYEITESIQKEMSDAMECGDDENQVTGVLDKVKKIPHVKKSQKQPNIEHSQEKRINKNKEIAIDDAQDDIDEINDLDLFASGSVKEANVQLLKDFKPVPSEIIKPTLKMTQTQVADKRVRDAIDDVDVEMPSNKRHKVDSLKAPEIDEADQIGEADEIDQADEINEAPKITKVLSLEKQLEQMYEEQQIQDSEGLTYDNVMSQVFANIDADMESGKRSNKTQKSSDKEHSKNMSQIIHKTQVTQRRPTPKVLSPRSPKSPNKVMEISDLKGQQKDSENVFSLLENDASEVMEKIEQSAAKLPEIVDKPQPKPQTITQEDIANFLTPGLCRDLDAFQSSSQAEKMDVEMEALPPALGTPVMEDDDDKSVVEETPQKNMSFQKPKPKSDGPNPGPDSVKATSAKASEDNRSSDSQGRSIINLTDTLTPGDFKTKNNTVLENKVQDLPNETPVSISKFTNQLKCNATSTPVARKSLNFERDHDDPELTLCATTTQEKEFMAEAFQKTPTAIRRQLSLKNVNTRDTSNFCLAGSNLGAHEIIKIKVLCSQQGWVFTEKYSDHLTHLVVAVDEDGRSQRTVKYICALAASKWIVSMIWVEKCLTTRTVVNEAPYEALDVNGEPGPKRAREAKEKLFHGITFYLHPPFSVVPHDTLRKIITLAGGCVVTLLREARVTDHRVRLLLAEPETTQEDRFIYMTMEQGIVPVNFEWVFNCLGTYQLCTIRSLLLCPITLLPPAVEQWAASAVFQEVNDDDEDPTPTD